MGHRSVRVRSAIKGFFFGQLEGSGNGKCHIFAEWPGEDPRRLPHIALCNASTGRGAIVVEEPTRELCSKCEDRYLKMDKGECK